MGQHHGESRTGAISESIQCTLEARLEGHQPLAIKHHGANLNQAIEGAAEKMSRLIDSTLGRSARG